MIALEVGNLNGLIFFFLLIMFGPPLLLGVFGAIVRKNSPKAAKVLYILAVLYLLVGLGICGSLMV
ncbi:hypothetical protein [Flavobacterium sp. J27]|uniref:hypothetical protein n=1 Tax=Flavobacterium sp. J27 TaxID=2060419 RepID=UPI001030F497|nr:hypothetical protein [Flavobacterium sp. J27]